MKLTGKSGNSDESWRLPDEPSLLDASGEAALKAVFSLVPVVGPFAAEFLAVFLHASTEKKTHQLLTYMFREIEDLKKSSGLTVEQVFQDEQFQPYLVRAMMASWEAYEDVKIAALATAAVNSGAWNPLPNAEREFYWTMLRKYHSLHIETLKLFRFTFTQTNTESPINNLDDYFRYTVGFPAHHDEIGRSILNELYQDGLLANGFGLGYSLPPKRGEGLTTLGGDFLTFIHATAEKDGFHARRPEAGDSIP